MGVSLLDVQIALSADFPNHKTSEVTGGIKSMTKQRYKVGVLRSAICKVARVIDKSHVRVFMFHRFSESLDPRKTNVALFRRQMEQIKNNYTPVSFSMAARAILEGRRVKRPYVCITVDDGHVDFFQLAWPVLQSLNIPATVFVTTSFMDGAWLWADALEHVIFSAKEGRFEVELPSGGYGFQLTTDDAQRRAVWRRIASELKWNNQARDRVIADLARALKFQLPQSPTPDYASMGWGAARKLAENGIEIGGHTISHSYLPGLDDSALDRELRQGREQIEAQISKPVLALAYPNGSAKDVDERVVNAAKNSGYACAAVAYKPTHGVAASDVFRIGRWPAGNDMRSFEYALSGATHIKRKVMTSLGREIAN
jgi:peptidoglycan/xylan/chitin deacetylase (PgdA/CDA1 family)